MIGKRVGTEAAKVVEQLHPRTTTTAASSIISEARAEIIGPPIRYLTPDSTLRLVCRVVQSTETAAFLFWYQDDRMINFDTGINITTQAGEMRGWRVVLLLVSNATPNPVPVFLPSFRHRLPLL